MNQKRHVGQGRVIRTYLYPGNKEEGGSPVPETTAEKLVVHTIPGGEIVQSRDLASKVQEKAEVALKACLMTECDMSNIEKLLREIVDLAGKFATDK